MPWPQRGQRERGVAYLGQVAAGNAQVDGHGVHVQAALRHATAAGLDPVARQAWQWFVTEVPQRSLHNWQNAAARVIAADLRGTPVSTLG